MTGFETFLDQRVSPDYRAIVERFCDQMAQVAPKATQRMRGGTEKYYSVPVYRVNRDIVAISPTKTGITFSFTNGAQFEDPFDLLTGKGKHSRTIKVNKLDNYPNEAMAHYMRQAVQHDLV